MPSTLGRFEQLVAELADPRRINTARGEMDALLADPEHLLELRRAPEPVARIVAAVRVQVADPLRAYVESLLADWLMRLGMHRQALTGLEQLFASRPDCHDDNDTMRLLHAIALCQLAELQHWDGRFETAAGTARQARALTERQTAAPQQTGEPAQSPAALAQHAVAEGIEGRALLDLGDIAASWPLLERQYRYALELEAAGRANPDLSSRGRLMLAEYYGVQERFAQAEHLLTAPPFRDPALEIRRLVARLHQAEARRWTDDSPALEAAALADEQQLRTALDDPALEAGFVETSHLVLLRAAIDRGDRVTAREELAVLGQSVRGRPLAAEIAMLRTRLYLSIPEGAADTVSTTELEAQLARHEAAFADVLQEWRSSTVRRGGLGFLERASRRRILTELVRLTEHLRGTTAAARRAAEGLLAMQALTSTARLLHAPEASLDEVRATFTGERRGILCLIAEPAGSMLLAIDREREHLIPLPGSYALEQAVRHLNEAMAAPADAASAAAIESAARAAADLLLPPDARRLLANWDLVTVADHGMLAGLPWECLMLADGTLLGERIAVNTLTSLPLGVELVRRRSATPVTDRLELTLIATLAASPRLAGTEPGAPRTVPAEIATRLGGAYVACHPTLDGNATRKAVAAMSFPGPVTQLLAHGASRSPELPPGLALTPEDQDDGFFGPDDLQAGTVHGLVILSACEAGRGARQPGDETVHVTLGGAFLLAGADTVVQTRSGLHLLSHLRLMELVHRALANGTPVAEALRSARDKLRSNADLHERCEHAQVQVFGLGQLKVIGAS